MLRLIYRSRANCEMTSEELSQVLAKARIRNEAEEITGILIYHDSQFIQILEGPSDKVRKCYKRIEKDTRHTGVFVLQEQEVDNRAFSKWKMGHIQPCDLPKEMADSVIALSTLKDRMDQFSDMNVEDAKQVAARHVRFFLSRCSDFYKGAGASGEKAA